MTTLAEMAADWLATQQSTLWGRGFDIVQDPRPAADWFANQIEQFFEYAEDTLSVDAA